MKRPPPPPARLHAADLAAMEARLLRGPPRADVSVIMAYYRQVEQDCRRLLSEMRLMQIEARKVEQLGLMEGV